MNGYRSIGLGTLALLASCVMPLDIRIGDDDPDGVSIRGSGHVATVTRDVQAFHRIEVAGVGRVVLERTGRERLSITADDNVLRYIESEVEGGTLHIRPQPGVSVSHETTPVFRVEAVTLDRIVGSGAVSFDADLGPQPEVSVTLSGVCTLKARGAADRLEVFLSGVTGYRGLDLESREARVVASGASWVEVWVTERLDADASGTSVIRYAGNPEEVVARTSGLASIGSL
jgi:hypothetical protein